jgi:hypothetical protein
MNLKIKGWKRAYRSLAGMDELSEKDKILFARFAVATPDQRWQMNENYLRSLGCWGRCALDRFDTKS